MKGVLDQAGFLKKLVMGVIDPQKEEMDNAQEEIDKYFKAVEMEFRPKRDSAIDVDLLDMM